MGYRRGASWPDSVRAYRNGEERQAGRLQNESIHLFAGDTDRRGHCPLAPGSFMQSRHTGVAGAHWTTSGYAHPLPRTWSILSCPAPPSFLRRRGGPYYYRQLGGFVLNT